jgi:hypothetical protein
MATHYKGQRISDLLDEIEEIRQVLDDNLIATTPQEMALIAQGYATLALRKAQLTALQGDNHDKESKKPR